MRPSCLIKSILPISIAIVISSCGGLPSGLREMEDLQGTWMRINADEKMVEKWEIEKDHLIATHMVIFRNDTLANYQKKIELKDGKVQLTEKSNTTNPQVFTLVSSENGQWIFENPDQKGHRIVYHLAGPEELNTSTQIAGINMEKNYKRE
jgi:hypothetical protein